LERADPRHWGPRPSSQRGLLAELMRRMAELKEAQAAREALGKKKTRSPKGK
jgi:hypothetical protein